MKISNETQTKSDRAGMLIPVPIERKKRFKIACIEDGTDMTEVVNGFIVKYLAARDQHIKTKSNK